MADSNTTDVRPHCGSPEFENMPASMKAVTRWVLWRFDWNGSKWTKTPINARTGGKASSTNAATWTTFDDAVAAYRRGGVDGIGFVLGDGWSGIDLDDHLDGDGRVTPFAEDVLQRLPSYHEVSPSGEGIKIFIRATLEHGHADHKAGIEVYGIGRYFTVTGRKLSDSPAEVEDRQSELQRLLNDVKPPRTNTNAPAWRTLSDHDKALAALERLSSARAEGYSTWVSVGMALHAVDESLLDAWNRWSAESSKHDDHCCATAWAAFGRSGYTLASLIFWADEDSPGWRDRYSTSETRSRSKNSEQTKFVAPEAVVRRLSDVPPEELEWLWLNRIPLGKLTLFCGDPGLGKSYVTCDLAARVSRGRAWPDDSSQRQPVGSVVMFNCEDGLADTIRPRLDAAGADVSKIIAIEGVRMFDPDTGQPRQRGFTLAVDLPILAREVEKLSDCRLIVIDPVSAYLGDETDSHKNAEVRALLAPLAELAERHRASVLMVTHLTKSYGGKAVYRATGSLAFAAAARAVWFVCKDPDDERRRLMLPAKTNLAKEPLGLAYRIESGGIAWEADPVTIRADELLAKETGSKKGDDRSHQGEVAAWLREVLANGPLPAKRIFEDGRELHGMSPKVLRRALKAIGGEPRKDGMDGPWMWSLSNKPAA